MLLLLLVPLFSSRLFHTGEEGLGLFLILQYLKQYLVYGNVTQRVCSVRSDSLQSRGLQPTRLLCLWGSSRQEHWNGLPISSSRGSSQPRDWAHVSCVSCSDRQILYHWASWEIHSAVGFKPTPPGETATWTQHPELLGHPILQHLKACIACGWHCVNIPQLTEWRLEFENKTRLQTKLESELTNIWEGQGEMHIFNLNLFKNYKKSPLKLVKKS